MRFLLLAPVLLALGHAAMAADAASAPTGTAAQSVAVSASGAVAEPEAPKFTCHQESAIGSMMMHKVCTKVPTEAERNSLQEAMRENLPNNSIAHPAAAPGRKY